MRTQNFDDLANSAMRLSKRLLTLVAWSAIGSTLAGATPVVDAGQAQRDRGAQIYTALCATCHGDSGDGKGPMAGQLTEGPGPSPANLTTWVFQGSRSDNRLRRAIRGGGTAVHKSSAMPAWGQSLTDDQVEDVVAYIRDLKNGNAPSLTAVDPLDDELKIGKALYSIRCLPCHGSKGQGKGFLLDSLVDSGSAPVDVLLPNFSLHSEFQGRDDDNFVALITSGISHSGLALQTSNGWWNRSLELAELRALISYLRTLPEATPTSEPREPKRPKTD